MKCCNTFLKFPEYFKIIHKIMKYSLQEHSRTFEILLNYVQGILEIKEC